MRLSRQFWENQTFRFPILLNLRDHYGQKNPTEALERHAREVGFANPSHLVRAWRAGYAILLLDGFDEIATAGWAGRTKTLKDLRYRSMELIRNLVGQTPADAGLVISGRTHFFDNERELRNALGIDFQTVLLNLSEFTEDQVADFLKARGWSEAIPSWLPTRPLLLGYLASRNFLPQTLEVAVGASPAVGWNELLDRISAREAKIEAGIDAGTVRQITERLATFARASVDGLGPLSPRQITQAFTDVCGYEPDDQGMVLLQRLPGLGVHNAEDGSRVFIDGDLAETARAGDVFGFIDNPFSDSFDASNWHSALAPLGVEVLAPNGFLGRNY